MSTLVPDVCRRLDAGFPLDGSPFLPAIDGTRQLSSADYYIDFNAGNDSNNGTTPATPLATWNGFEIILGRYCGAVNGCTVHILDGSNAIDDPVNVATVLGAGQAFRVVNEVPAITLATSAVVTWTAPAGNAAAQLDAGVAFNTSAASIPNLRLRIVGGARDGAVAIVGSLGPAAAFVTVSQFLICSNQINTSPTPVTPLAGDTVVAEQSGSVLALGMFACSQTNGGAGAVAAYVSIENFELELSNFHAAASQLALMLFQCTFDPAASSVIVVDAGAQFLLRNCELPRLALVTTSGTQLFQSCAIQGGCGREGIVFCDGGSLIYSFGTLYEFPGGPSEGGIVVRFGGALSVDAMVMTGAFSGIADNAISLLSGSIGIFNNVSGAGGAGVGLYVDDASTAFVLDPTTMTLTGTAGDFLLGSNAGNARTFNEVTGLYTAPIAQTWANLATPVAGGGFGGSAVNVRTMAQIQPGIAGV